MSEAIVAPNAHEFSTQFSVIMQGSVQFYLFTMTATDLAKLILPVRFSEDRLHGVQRDVDPQHVKRLAAAMLKGHPIPSNFTLNMTGEWVIVGDQLYGVQGESALEALDGQHRSLAAESLVLAGKSSVTDQYTFTVMATINAPDKLRRELFMAQVHGKRITRDHAMAMRAMSGDFRSPGERDAHRVAEALMTREDSILKGRVHQGEKVRVGPRGRLELCEGKWLTQVALITALRQMTSPASLIASMSLEGKTQFVIDLLSAADEAYPTQFCDGGTLRTDYGISVLCLLAARKDGAFRTLLQQGGYSKATMLKLFRLVPKFMWRMRDSRTQRYHAPAQCVERFNARLSQALNNE